MTREEYHKKISELKEFSHSRGLAKPLQSRLLAFNRFLYDKKTVFDEKSILSDLPLHLRAEVVFAMYGDMIKDSFFFLVHIYLITRALRNDIHLPTCGVF